jgi:hypothetical protein
MSATVLQGAVAARDAASPKARWTGIVLSTIAVLFLTFDTVFKLVGAQAAVDGTVQLGYRPEDLLTIALIEIACLVLLLIPRTAVLGAILWTGYFGGAIATHMIAESPLFSHTIFPIYVAALIWGGLYLRDTRVRSLIKAR